MALVLPLSATLALFFTLLFSGTASAAPQATENTSRARLVQLREQVRAISTKLKREIAHQRREEDALEAVEVELGNTTRALLQVEATHTRLGGEQHALDARLGKLEQALGAERQALALLVRAAFSVGRRGDLAHLISNSRPTEAGRAIAYARYLHQRTEQRIATLATLKSEQAKVQEEAAAKRRNLATQAEHIRRTQAQLERQRDQRSRVLAGVNLRILDQRERLTHLRQDERHLTRLLGELRRALAHAPKRRPIQSQGQGQSQSQGKSQGQSQGQGQGEDRAKPRAQSPAHPAKRGRDTHLDTTELAERTRFAKLSGTLPWPVQGAISPTHGTKTSARGPRAKGLWFKAASGAEVRAVAGGQVAFADWLRGFGLLLIVDHGDGYMSLYGHNATLLKEAGDWVDSGQVVALLGDSGGLDEAALYFEIRAKGDAVDARPWLRARPRARRTTVAPARRG